MSFRVWQESAGFAPSLGFLCVEQGSSDAGKVWNFTTSAWVTTASNPATGDTIVAMTELSGWSVLDNKIYYYEATALGTSPGRVIALIFNGTTYVGQGEELYIQDNAKSIELLTAQVVSGVSLKRWIRAIGAVLFGAVDPNSSGGSTSHAFKYPAAGTTYVTVTTDDAEDGKRTAVTIAS